MPDLFARTVTRQNHGADALTGPAAAVRQQNVLFVSSNGIGLGHLSRQLAVARRLAAGQTAVFHTLSYAAGEVSRSGYLYFGTQHHRATGMEQEIWNKALGEDYCGLIEALRPKAFVHDATVVFGGTVEALLRNPDMASIWIRRPMWRAAHERFLQHSGLFKMIIEPGELAGQLDDGPTSSRRGEALCVPPVLHTDPSERLSRQEARRVLGLPETGMIICLQLPEHTDPHIQAIRADILDRLLAKPDVIVVELKSPLTAGNGMPVDPRVRALHLYPAFRYSLAWDAAVAAAGYNSFHENVLGAVPTLFVPNEGDEMDRQELRAQWADWQGCGIMLRRQDAKNLDGPVERLLDTNERDRIASRCHIIGWTNGAAAIARQVDELAPVR